MLNLIINHSKKKNKIVKIHNKKTKNHLRHHNNHNLIILIKKTIYLLE